MFRRPFVLLDTIHLVVLLALAATTAYLIAQSISLKLANCAGLYTRCTSQIDYLRRRLKKPTQPPPDGQQLNFDWLGLSQYTVTASALAVALAGLVAALRRSRRYLLVVILLYVILIIQLALIQASDDRDFPANLFRDGYNLIRYALVYSDASIRSLILKSLAVALILVHFLLLIIYFCALRFQVIQAHLSRSRKRPKRHHGQVAPVAQ